MKLLTKAILKATPPLYANEDKMPTDIPVTAKFFTPWAGWSWYMTEYDPETRTAFGWVFGFESEMGYFSLGELASVEAPLDSESRGTSTSDHAPLHRSCPLTARGKVPTPHLSPSSVLGGLRRCRISYWGTAYGSRAPEGVHSA